MAVFKPFRALRPVPKYAADIASLPYDVMDSDEARIEVKKHPLSYIHVEKPEVDLPVGTDLYDPAVYAKAKENLDNYSRQGYMMQDPKPYFYIYCQTMDGREQNGLVGLASVDEYMDGKIKKHEFTRADKEADRIRHVDTCDAHPSPVFSPTVTRMLSTLWWRKLNRPKTLFTTSFPTTASAIRSGWWMSLLTSPPSKTLLPKWIASMWLTGITAPPARPRWAFCAGKNIRITPEKKSSISS